MAYLIGADVGYGRVTLPAAKPTNTRPASRSAGRTAPGIPDEEDARGYRAYVDHIYGGLVSNKPEVQKAVSGQYDYNKKRVLAGKEPLKIADVRWDPTAYDDGMNEWMNQRYQKTGKLPSGEERLDHMQEEDSRKRRESFEPAGAPQSAQSNSIKTSLYMVNEEQRQIDQKQQEQNRQKSLDAVKGMLDAGKQKDFSSLTPQEVAAGVQDVLRRRAISEGPVALANLRQRRAEEAGGLGALPTPASRQLKADDAEPVFGRIMAVENGLVDGSAGWAIDLQNRTNQGNPNARFTLAPYLETKDALQKKYPGAFATGSIAGMLASGYLYGAPAKAGEAAGVALRRAAAEEVAAGQRSAVQAAREAELGNNPLAAALEKAQAKLAHPADDVAQDLAKGYTGGEKVGLQGAQEDVASQLTRAQRRNTNALQNIIENNLKDSDFSGALADLQEKPIPNGSGGFFDHLTEMKQSYVGLKGINNGIEGSLRNPNLSSEVRAHLQQILDTTNYYLEKIEDLFKPYGGIQ